MTDSNGMSDNAPDMRREAPVRQTVPASRLNLPSVDEVTEMIRRAAPPGHA